MSRLGKIVCLLWAFWLAPDLYATELLRHISDDTEPAPLPAAQPQNDRQIIYRVICSPDGEALPDCERPFADRESVQKAIAEEAAPDAGDMPDEDSAASTQVKKPAKPTAKKAKSTKKKADKKTKSQAKPKKSAKKTKSSKH